MYSIENLVSVVVFSGGHTEEVTPVPISNTEAKLLKADGTASLRCGRVGSRRDIKYTLVPFGTRVFWFQRNQKFGNI